MTQADGKMEIKKITIINSLWCDPTFTTPEAAINYSTFYDQKRKQELGLDITSIYGQVVKQFHWDNQNLILEFNDGLFLKITICDQIFDIQIVKSHFVITDRNTIFDITMPSGMQYQWTPQKIAEKYIGQEFVKIYLGEHEMWLYFKAMPLLIYCTIDTIKESKQLFLSWIESE
jgi:hypothetical protein